MSNLLKALVRAAVAAGANGAGLYDRINTIIRKVTTIAIVAMVIIGVAKQISHSSDFTSWFALVLFGIAGAILWREPLLWGTPEAMAWTRIEEPAELLRKIRSIFFFCLGIVIASSLAIVIFPVEERPAVIPIAILASTAGTLIGLAQTSFKKAVAAAVIPVIVAVLLFLVVNSAEGKTTSSPAGPKRTSAIPTEVIYAHVVHDGGVFPMPVGMVELTIPAPPAGKPFTEVTLLACDGARNFWSEPPPVGRSVQMNKNRCQEGKWVIETHDYSPATPGTPYRICVRNAGPAIKIRVGCRN